MSIISDDYSTDNSPLYHAKEDFKYKCDKLQVLHQFVLNAFILYRDYEPTNEHSSFFNNLLLLIGPTKGYFAHAYLELQDATVTEDTVKHWNDEIDSGIKEIKKIIVDNILELSAIIINSLKEDIDPLEREIIKIIDKEIPLADREVIDLSNLEGLPLHVLRTTGEIL